MKKSLLKLTLGLVAITFGISSFAQCPTIICPGNVTINNDTGNCDAVVTYNVPSTIDTCNPGYQIYVVPSGVTSITIDAFGAQGGIAHTPGLGGRTQGTMAVTPGQTLYIFVGGQGALPGGGWNGGGIGGSTPAITVAGGGGGASDIRFGGTTLNDRIMVAAGGGGGGGASTYSPVGGAGGGGASCVSPNGIGGGLANGACASSTAGSCVPGVSGGYGSGGAGAGLTAGGPGGQGGTGSFGTAGVLGVGGDGGAWSGRNGAGGGGGGYYGGGGGMSGSGGCNGGGGGGSSYVDNVAFTGITFTGGVRTGNGQIAITSIMGTTTYNFTGGGSVLTTTQIAGLASGSIFPVGTTTNTFFVSDAINNTDTCSFTVTVIDAEAPAITCPANITLNNDSGMCDAVATYVAPIGTDNCTGVTTVLTSGLASGSSFPVGTTTITYTATDAGNNTTPCSFTVTVIDVDVPTITCPSNVVSCDSTVAVNGIAPTSTGDNCPGEAVTYTLSGVTTGTGTTDASGTMFNVGITTIWYYVTDSAGNNDSCSFNVEVKACPVGINENASLNGVNIYPNPTNGLVTINLGNHKGTVNYSLSTVEGRIVTQKQNVVSNNITIDLSTESNGIYLLKIEDDTSSKTYKIIRE